MQELTILLFTAGLIVGSLFFFAKKTDRKFAILTMMVNLCAVGAVVTDADIIATTDYTLTLAVIIPLIFLMYAGVELIVGRR